MIHLWTKKKENIDIELKYYIVTSQINFFRVFFSPSLYSSSHPRWPPLGHVFAIAMSATVTQDKKKKILWSLLHYIYRNICWNTLSFVKLLAFLLFGTSIVICIAIGLRWMRSVSSDPSYCFLSYKLSPLRFRKVSSCFVLTAL